MATIQRTTSPPRATAVSTEASVPATESTATEASAASTSGPNETDETAGTATASAAGWTVDTEACVDPDRANAPIEGPISIGSSMPLSGGPAASAFAPIRAGLQAYIDYANENDLVPGRELTLNVGDDQYDPALTPGVVNGLLDDGVQLFTGIVGTPNNASVRDLLNEECVPQMLGGSGFPGFAEVTEYPWSTTSLVPYDVESAAYAADIAREFPDGATVGVFAVSNEFGSAYTDAFEELSGEFNLDIVDSQTIDAADTAPPAAQLASIAGNAPDVIIAIPLGAQCPTFLNELANQKAANPGWEPQVYLASACANRLILGAAGEAAEGVRSSLAAGLIDIANEETHTIPGVAEYLAYIESKGLTDTVPTSAAGWVVGEVTVEILRRAAESPEGLTQASIINTARNLDFEPSVVQEGIHYKMAGEQDSNYVEDVQIVQYDAAATVWNNVGELITEFASS